MKIPKLTSKEILKECAIADAAKDFIKLATDADCGLQITFNKGSIFCVPLTPILYSASKSEEARLSLLNLRELI